ncbi:hypothetical protein [Kitasatospora sp. NPDC096204]|uniref:hypothetical protein n=1 Tax=Kitasatospora sp. NPDC096204 TaxID=3364094 RepID=UPI0037F63B9A
MTTVVPDLPVRPAVPEHRYRSGIRAGLVRRAAERRWPAMSHRGIHRALPART